MSVSLDAPDSLLDDALRQPRLQVLKGLHLLGRRASQSPESWAEAQKQTTSVLHGRWRTLCEPGLPFSERW